jgi:hypothetical protein
MEWTLETPKWVARWLQIVKEASMREMAHDDSWLTLEVPS